mgnify:CR=1 FL=1
MTDRFPWLPLAGVALACAAFTCAGAAMAPTTAVVGSELTEAPAHLWALWDATNGMFERGPLVRVANIYYPHGFRLHVMDPINLVVFAPAYWLAGGGPTGAAVAWNLLHGVAPLVGAACLWPLLKRAVGSTAALPWAGALAGVVFLASPFFLLYHRMGRTEFLPAVLYPLHVAFMHRWLRRPVGIDGGDLEPPPPAWVGVAAALSLSAVALGGTYLSVFGLLFTGILSLVWARGLGPREATWRIALVAGLSVLPVLPAVYALFDAWPAGKSRELEAGLFTFDDSEVQWGTSFLTAVRLASPSNRTDLDFAPYVGTLPVVLSFVAAYLRPRQAWPWALLVATTFVMGSGSTFYLGAFTTAFNGAPMPPMLLSKLFPPLQNIRSWSRLMVLGSMAAGLGTAVLVAVLWPRVGERGRRLVQLGLLLTVVDQLTWPKTPKWPPVSFPAAAPEALVAAASTLPPGGLVALPMDVPLLLPWGAEEQGLWPLWQLTLDRPLSTNFQGQYDHFVDTLFGQAIVSRQRLCYTALNSRCTRKEFESHQDEFDEALAEEEAKDEAEDEQPLDLAAIRGEISSFWWDGYSGIVLVEELEGGPALRSLLTELLGDPTFDRAGVVAWNTREGAVWDERTESRLREAPLPDDAELREGLQGEGPEWDIGRAGGVTAPGGVTDPGSTADDEEAP